MTQSSSMSARKGRREDCLIKEKTSGHGGERKKVREGEGEICLSVSQLKLCYGVVIFDRHFNAGQ